MKRFWEIVIGAEGSDRVYCAPFLSLFRLLTPLYQYFSRRNLRRRRARRSCGWRAKVISLGNLTVGGSGKSPIVVWLARHLAAQGKRIVIVHSGYGRLRETDIIIPYAGAGDFSVAAIGDETAMMARMAPEAGFAIGRDKKKMLAAADRELSPDVILIDDGYQRLDIAKDLDAVVISDDLLSAIMAGGKNAPRLFPGGVLREPLASLDRADAVFVTTSGGETLTGVDAAIRTYNNQASICRWRFALDGVEHDGRQSGIAEMTERKPYLFAGIGSYRRLLRMLEQAGIACVGEYNFGDHYRYDKSDFKYLRELSSGVGADCYLTTAKDRVKLPAAGLDKPVYCLRLGVEPLDPGQVTSLLSRV